MTRTLILMRHAKSSWGDPGLSDHARPLNKRGRASATALGNWLQAQGHLPDEVLCSSSERTRETLARLDLSAPATFTDALYHAEPERMLALLQAATGDSVLMLGHNPGIAGFAQWLVGHPPAHERFSDYPTGATLVARFGIDSWKELRPGAGRVAGFIIPRELTT